LFSLVEGDDEVAARDRAILKTFLYTGIRIGTACRLEAFDFRQNEEGDVLLITEKGRMRGRNKAVKREIGVHFAAAQEINGYLAISGITNGPLFRRQLNSRVRRLSDEGMTTRGLYKLLERYFSELPGTLETRVVTVTDADTGHARCVERAACIYTPHSLRATTATVLLDSGVDIRKVQKLLGHKAVTTTQIYDKRRHAAKDSASHEVIF
jgi:integrase